MSTCTICGGSGVQRVSSQRSRTCLVCLGQGILSAATKPAPLSHQPGADEEALMEVAIEVGAEDVETAEDGSIEVTTDPGDFLTVKEALLEAGFEPEMSELGMVAQNLTELDPDASEKVIRLIDHLEDLDDVQNVYTNAAFSDE